MEFKPYKINECFEHLYYQIPQELFFNPFYKDKLSSDSKILYGFLLNRLTLSAKNNWFDENGTIYLIFTRKEVQNLLNLSDKTVTKAFKQLTDCNLIYEKKRGSTKPNYIYVGKIEHDKNIEKVIRKKAEAVKASPVTASVYRKNSVSRVGESTISESENLRARNNYINKNYIGNAPKQKKKFCNFDERVYPEEFLNGLYVNQF